MVITTKKERFLWLDVAKGITILLMVVGHSSIPQSLSNFIWTFHMPFFFIASGLTTKFNKNGSDFILGKMRTLICPFLLYSIILILLYSYIYDRPLLSEFLLVVNKGWKGVPMWFIPVLFLSLLVALAGVKTLNSRKNVYFIIICTLLPLVGAALCRNHLYLPWTLSTVPIASFFIVMGFVLRPYVHKIVEFHWWKLGVSFILTLVVSLFWRLDMCWNDVLPLVPILIGAFSGTWFVMLASVWISNHTKIASNILQKIGKETYIIMAFSEVTIVFFNQKCPMNPLLKYVALVLILWSIVKIRSILLSCFHCQK